MLLLDTRNVVIDQERVYQGNVSASLVRVGELFRSALERHASGMGLCDGDALRRDRRLALLADRPEGHALPQPMHA